MGINDIMSILSSNELGPSCLLLFILTIYKNNLVNFKTLFILLPYSRTLAIALIILVITHWVQSWLLPLVITHWVQCSFFVSKFQKQKGIKSTIIIINNL